MGIVKYIYKEGRKVFSIPQALMDGWGIEYNDQTNLVGLKLQDRQKRTYKTEIIGNDEFMGLIRVYFKGGGWLCLDHAIEQFKVV
jgi:hypothetical protein